MTKQQAEYLTAVNTAEAMKPVLRLCHPLQRLQTLADAMRRAGDEELALFLESKKSDTRLLAICSKPRLSPEDHAYINGLCMHEVE